MTSHLTVTTNRQQATATILAAIEAGTLTAPHGLQGSYASANEHGVLCHCAIGILFPPTTAVALEHLAGDSEDPEVAAILPELGALLGGRGYSMARDLIKGGLLVVPEDEVEWFANLQRKQDDWARAVCDRHEPQIVEDRKQVFLDHLKL